MDWIATMNNVAKTTILNLTEEEFVHSGNRACSGCGLSILYRIGLKALGRDCIFVVPPSCLTVMQGLYPVAATQMPVLNGYEATAAIKKIRPSVPIIAQTAFALADEKEESLNAGCDNYITKPINKIILIDMINKYLNM